MKCLACGNPLPSGSEFCQYCGKKIEVPKEEKSRGRAFQSVCIGVLTALCVASIGLNIFQHMKNISMNEQLIQSMETMWDQEETIYKLETKIAKQEREIENLKGDSSSNYWEEKLAELEKEIAARETT